MGGGHFNHVEHRLKDFVEVLKQDIRCGQLSEETIGYASRMVKALEAMYDLLHTYSGDFQEDARKHFGPILQKMTQEQFDTLSCGDAILNVETGREYMVTVDSGGSKFITFGESFFIVGPTGFSLARKLVSFCSCGCLVHFDLKKQERIITLCDQHQKS